MRKQPLHPRTAVINQKQKNLSKNARLSALSWLATTFPEAFDNAEQIRPLKKGILNDVLEYAQKAATVGISKSKLREAIVVFTRRVDYLTVLKAQEQRIDLFGKEIEGVTEEEAEKAALKLRRRVEKSTKAARKLYFSKSTSSSKPEAIESPRYNHKDKSYHAEQSSYRGMDKYVSENSAPPNSTAVVVKRKLTRQYDPNAVARLKEKLGISASEEQVSD